MSQQALRLSINHITQSKYDGQHLSTVMPFTFSTLHRNTPFQALP
jgi:hypothetical protein